MARDDREHWDAKHANRADRDAPPAPFLVAHAHRLPLGRTLDVAAGTGRNARFLAGLGHRVVAVDVSGIGLAILRAIAPDVACVQMDLDRPGHPARCLRRRRGRQLPRSSAASTTAVDWVRPGGVVLWETFLREQRDIGHPRNPDWLLERGELRARLGPRCEVLAECEGLVDEPGGRAFRSGIVVRRRR